MQKEKVLDTMRVKFNKNVSLVERNTILSSAFKKSRRYNKIKIRKKAFAKDAKGKGLNMQCNEFLTL